MTDGPMKVTLLAYTPAPVQLAALAARRCYSGMTVEKLRTRVEEEDQTAFIGDVVGSGHASVLEHVNFTFALEGVSRILLAQITRHRIASFSVQSQRYVGLQKSFDYVTPPAIQQLGEEAVREYDAQMAQMHAWYCGWREKLGGKGEAANEDARFVMPGACQTSIVVTMNARELHHFFSIRCCERAQWEIRAAARWMLALCRQVSPELFEQAGPSCVRGACVEGKRSCGKAKQVREALEELGKTVNAWRDAGHEGQNEETVE